MENGNAKIKARALRIVALRVKVATEEGALAADLKRFLTPHGSTRETAKRLHVSPQYLSDVAHGRRRASTMVTERLATML